MYILIATNGYPTKKYRGMGIFEFDQAKALVKTGCKVVFAAVDVRSIRRWRKWGIEHHEIEGVSVYAINIPGGKLPKWLLLKLSSLGMKIIYNRIVKDHGKPDILHAHFTYMGYASYKLKNKMNLPLVITEHSSEMIKKPILDKKLFNICEKTYNEANAVIAVSPFLRDVIEKNFQLCVKYVPNIVDTDLFEYRPKIEDEKFNFVSTGNLVNLKRMDLLIDAFYNAFKNFRNVTLTIFGDGTERHKLEEQIKSYSLEDRVFLMGMCSRATIAKKLNDSNCFVLASMYETFGVAYIEALASGIPVIATRCGGPESFINEKNGIMIPVDDINELTNSLIYMYENYKLYNGKLISDEIKSNFSPECISKKLIDIYCEIKN